MIAARRRELRLRAFCLAHTAIFEEPRVTICVGGAENGRLSREVTKDRRRRRFFSSSAWLPSPRHRRRQEAVFASDERACIVAGRRINVVKKGWGMGDAVAAVLHVPRLRQISAAGR